MNRRNFLQLSSLAVLSSLLGKCKDVKQEFPIHISSDANVGHLLFQSQNFDKENQIQKTDFLIVGGGVAGISTAHKLSGEKFFLYELSESFGGSSGSSSYQNNRFSQGAHYDLEYPHYFGEEVLAFLEELNIIKFNLQRNYWEFIDKKYLINGEIEEQALILPNILYNDVFVKTAKARKFLDFTEKYIGKMLLPTRLIEKKYQDLDKISLYNLLVKKNILLNEELVQGIDYQMLDDFGGTSKQVSALAGMYYYASRRYRDSESEIFSPPQGNYYFIEKMLERIPQENIFTQHLVQKIIPQKKGFEVSVIDFQHKKIKRVLAKKIVYAGHKHTLKYVFPQDYSLFAQTETAPWLVINLILKENELPTGFWQNEIISKKHKKWSNFMGFVDSDSQFEQNKRILTVYYCLDANARKDLLNLEKYKKDLINYTLKNIALYFEQDFDFIQNLVEVAFIKVMGHAMPIPKPNYLFKDKNQFRSHQDLVYAGVDNARLPLFLEAVDSGLEAIKQLQKS